uniref:Uncharacterized protein n=1 Tax=Picocystis salinarum TaxID=88271 RepID=A0A6U9RJH3_9CHLO
MAVRQLQMAKKAWEDGHVRGGRAMHVVAKLATEWNTHERSEKEMHVPLARAVEETVREKARTAVHDALDALERMEDACEHMRNAQECVRKGTCREWIRRLATGYESERKRKRQAAWIAFQTMRRCCPTCLQANDVAAIQNRFHNDLARADRDGNVRENTLQSTSAWTLDDNATDSRERRRGVRDPPTMEQHMVVCQTIWKLHLETDPSSVDKLIQIILRPG